MYKVDLRSGGCPCKNSGHEAVSLNLCQQESFSSQHECPVFLEPRPPHTVFRVLEVVGLERKRTTSAKVDIRWF